MTGNFRKGRAFLLGDAAHGAAKAELAAWCAAQDLPLHAFDWRSEYEAAGLARNAIYLLRPDSYVALADGSAAPSVLERYFADRGIRLAPLLRNQ